MFLNELNSLKYFQMCLLKNFTLLPAELFHHQNGMKQEKEMDFGR